MVGKSTRQVSIASIVNISGRHHYHFARCLDEFLHRGAGLFEPGFLGRVAHDLDDALHDGVREATSVLSLFYSRFKPLGVRGKVIESAPPNIEALSFRG